MIVIESIEGKNGSRKPKALPESPYIGIHSDESSFYFFESEEERTSFMAALPVVPEVPAAHNNIALDILKSSTPEEISQIKEMLQ